jgi:hypothetical protein
LPSRSTRFPLRRYRSEGYSGTAGICIDARKVSVAASISSAIGSVIVVGLLEASSQGAPVFGGGAGYGQCDDGSHSACSWDDGMYPARLVNEYDAVA